ncbi:hypothetical protein TNCV_2072761 [Trichonephila clavipes]|nr:hypothetical protein TNCV_2072761 [Trichonephila clavipes]
MGIDGNEKANFLARTAAEEWMSLTWSLSFSTLSSFKKIELNELGGTPPSHPWYFERNHSGLCQGNTTLSSRALSFLNSWPFVALVDNLGLVTTITVQKTHSSERYPTHFAPCKEQNVLDLLRRNPSTMFGIRVTRAPPSMCLELRNDPYSRKS